MRVRRCVRSVSAWGYPAVVRGLSAGELPCPPRRREGDTMDEKGVRIALVVVNLFAAVSAIVGAIGLLVGFMDIPLSELTGTPFTDFTVPALLLGIVVGGSALVAAIVDSQGRGGSRRWRPRLRAASWWAG